MEDGEALLLKIMLRERQRRGRRRKRKRREGEGKRRVREMPGDRKSEIERSGGCYRGWEQK